VVDSNDCAYPHGASDWLYGVYLVLAVLTAPLALWRVQSAWRSYRKLTVHAVLHPILFAVSLRVLVGEC
jgi:hypothetical protein